MATRYALFTLGSVDSTQDEAYRRAGEGASPVLVVAERQVAGRGRSGHEWRQAPRALFSSLAFFPTWPPELWPRLTLVTGLAVRHALTEHTGVEPGLKWPNDLVTDEGKVGGILTEAETGMVVIGCGVNLWWPDARAGSAPPEGVAAVCADDPGEGLALWIAETWASRLLDATERSPASWGRDAYRAACVTVGDEIRWDPDGRGRAVDIDPAGGLVVDTASGRRTLVAGEVRSVRKET